MPCTLKAPYWGPGIMDCRGVIWVKLVGVAVLSREFSHQSCDDNLSLYCPGLPGCEGVRGVCDGEA